MYFRFSEFYCLSPFPATEWQLVRFARYLANGVTSYDTVKQYLSKIKKLHELGKFPFPQDLSILKHHMRAIRRELAAEIKKAFPMTPVILKKIYNVIDLNDNVEVIAYYGLLIGFCLFLRKSNLVPDTRTTFNPKEQLTRGDVLFRKNMVLFDVRWAKTNQYRKRDLLLPVGRARNKELCPVYWSTYIQTRIPGRSNDPLLSYLLCNEQRVVLTYDVLSRKLKKWVQLVGLDPAQFSLHSLRRGGANHALTCGLNGEDVKLMGDWRSNAYMEYIDLTLDRRVANVVKFMEEVDNMADQAFLCDDSDDDWF